MLELKKNKFSSNYYFISGGNNMFCTKCGKENDNNATFCKFCGAPIGNAAAAAPQSAPQPTPVQNSSAPQYIAPQATGGASLNLSSNTVDLIDLILRGAFAIVGILVIIGCIGTMGTTGSIAKNALGSLFGGGDKLVKLVKALYNFVVLIRVAAIITFCLAIADVAFTFVTNRKALTSFVSGGIGALIFIFHFILFGLASGAVLGGAIAFGVILILLSIALVGISVFVALKNSYVKKIMKK